MEHQDFDVVVLNPKKESSSRPTCETVMKNSGSKNKQTIHYQNITRIEKKVEEGDFSIPKVTRSLQVQIQQARGAKQWTQKQLAHACGMKESIIRDYENGTAIPDPSEMNKMSHILGVSLKK